MSDPISRDKQELPALGVGFFTSTLLDHVLMVADPSIFPLVPISAFRILFFVDSCENMLAG